jgi:branched-chain amino acid transport system permease protein
VSTLPGGMAAAPPTPAPPPGPGRSFAWRWACLAAVLALPLIDLALPDGLKVASLVPPILVFAILGLGLNIVAGFTGLLNLGSAAFMAIGAYAFAISSSPVYPFQIGFWPALALATAMGALCGLVLALPTMRLRGDYLAIVTLGFGEIVQDVLKNLDAITKGTQGLNPVPTPTLFGYHFSTANFVPWYYLFLALLLLAVGLCRNLLRSRIGRAWIAVREDELAARSMGISAAKAKTIAMVIGAALCAGGGALWSSLQGTSIEPGYYNFQLSVIVLCIVIVGGLGSIPGVLLGALIMIGFNSIVLVKLSELLGRHGVGGGSNVLASPNNWKYLIYGLALILMMRLKPAGLLPAKDVEREIARGQDLAAGAPP